MRAGVAAAAAGALAWTFLLDTRLSFRWGHGPDNRLFPVAAADFLLENRLPPPLYNDYNDGGYLIYRLHPAFGVFQDGRTSTYPGELFAALGDRSGLGLLRLLRDQGVNTAVVHRDKYGTLFRDWEWGTVFWDDTTRLLVRRSAANEPLLRRLEYRICLPGRPLPSERDRLVVAVDELRRNQAERLEPSWHIAVGLGVAFTRLGDLPAAEAEFARAAALAPAEPEPWARLSSARSSLGRREDADAALARARALDPDGKRVDAILRDGRSSPPDGGALPPAGRPVSPP